MQPLLQIKQSVSTELENEERVSFTEDCILHYVKKRIPNLRPTGSTFYYFCFILFLFSNSYAQVFPMQGSLQITPAGKVAWRELVAEGAGRLLNAEGKFIDNLLETDYAKYLARKTAQGKPPRGRPDWKETRDYWLFDSPMARGNAFNKKAGKLYDVNELNLENMKRLDSYVEPINGKQGEIISRKATNLEEIELSTFERYLKEMQTKYAVGTKIKSNAYPLLDGKLLQGKQILEIPTSNQNFSQIQDYIDLARNKYNIEIRFTPE